MKLEIAPGKDGKLPLHEDEIASFQEGVAHDKLISRSLLEYIDNLVIVTKQ